jgi:serine protease AprX
MLTMRIWSLRWWAVPCAVLPLLTLWIFVPVAPQAASNSSADVIVQARPGQSGTAASSIREAGGKIVRTWRVISGLEAKVPINKLYGLRRAAGIRYVSPNAPAYTSTSNNAGAGAASSNVYNQALNAASAWGSGDTGQGIGVALVDTGVTAVPGLRHANIKRVAVDPTINPNDVYDYFGHGTFLAGLIVGDRLRRGFRGVAPDATLISVKAADDQGNSSSADVLTAIQWVIDHQQQYNIRVMNLSLNSPVQDSYLVDPLDAAVELAWLHGITVIVSAGNCGDGADTVSQSTSAPYCPQVPAGQAETYAPANDPFVIAVGGTNDQGTADTSAATVAPWSSHGMTFDGTSRPDTYAPGSHILSLLPRNSVLTGEARSKGDGLYQMGGTSVSTAEVSGVAALAFSAHPDWTPDQFKSALLATSQSIAGGTANYPNAGALANFFGDPGTANQGIQLNNFVATATCTQTCQAVYDTTINPSLLTWDLLTWDSLTSNGNSLSNFVWQQTADGYAATTWTGTDRSGNLVTQDLLTWNLLTWDLLTWDLLTWDGGVWSTSPNF